MGILCYHLRPSSHGWRVCVPPDPNFHCREPNPLPSTPTLTPSQQSLSPHCAPGTGKWGTTEWEPSCDLLPRYQSASQGTCLSDHFQNFLKKYLQKISIYHGVEFTEINFFFMSFLFMPFQIKQAALSLRLLPSCAPIPYLPFLFSHSTHRHKATICTQKCCHIEGTAFTFRKLSENFQKTKTIFLHIHIF